MINQMISFQSENCPSPTSRIHPPVTNKCRHFSTGSCKFSHIYDGILPLLALCSMLLFLLFCLPLLTFTRNQIQQKVLAYAIAPPILQTHVIDNWWGVLYPPPALSGGVMPEENSKNQSADSVSDALIFDNDMNWLSQKKHIIFDVNKKATSLISSKADPMTCSNHSERSGTASARCRVRDAARNCWCRAATRGPRGRNCASSSALRRGGPSDAGYRAK